MKRRLRRLLRLRNSSGFTLVEVIVACALLGILVLGVMGFATPILMTVRDKEKNSRAFMLADAVSTYIATATQNAYYVVTFSGVAAGDTSGIAPKVVSMTYNGTEFPETGGGLSTLKECYDKLEKDKYEIRCIGMRWTEDKISKEKKLMLTNEKVDPEKLTLNPSKSKPVFEDCFYTGLYPIITFENYNRQYGDKALDDETKKIAPGLGLIVDVYTSLDCYSTDSSVREDAMFSMSGTSYIGFNNIRSTVTNTADKTGRREYEIVPNQVANTYDAALAKDSSAVYTEEGKNYYYTESFIYYVVHKAVQDA